MVVTTKYSKYKLEDEIYSIHIQVMLDIRQTSIEHKFFFENQQFIIQSLIADCSNYYVVIYIQNKTTGKIKRKEKKKKNNMKEKNKNRKKLEKAI